MLQVTKVVLKGCFYAWTSKLTVYRESDEKTHKTRNCIFSVAME